MFYVADRTEMQEIDRLTIEEKGVPGILLMERAAITVLEEINSRLKSINADRKLKCLVVVEGGNNGGDGLALARLLYQQGDIVHVCYINGISRVSDSFSYQLEIAKKIGIQVTDHIIDSDYDVVVDGIFGVGLKRDVAGIWRETIETMNGLGFKVAIDTPSGVDASTGQIMGCAFRAGMTVTFGLNKRGLIFYPGCEISGEVVVRDIGFAQAEVDRVHPVAYSYNRDDLCMLPGRSDSSNKGTYGKLAVIAGSRDMSGAMTFAAEAAYRMGTGLVKIYTHIDNKEIAGVRIPEAVLMCYSNKDEAEQCARDAVEWSDAILIGPGIGKGDAARSMVEYIMCEAVQTVIADADALNIISEKPDILGRHRGPVIVTPHIGEMSRLTGVAIPDIKKNILEVCKDFSMEYNVVSALKDARTCVSDGRDVYINTSGNNGMSTAGAGDVLAGIIAGLVCTGLGAYEAAKLGVYIHGLAGDMAAEHRGRNAMIARDIVSAISEVIKGAEHDGQQ